MPLFLSEDIQGKPIRDRKLANLCEISSRYKLTTDLANKLFSHTQLFQDSLCFTEKWLFKWIN